MKLDKLKAIVVGITLGVAVLGFLPVADLDFRVSKEILAQFAVLTAIALLFYRNVWVRMFVLWSIVRTFLTYNGQSSVTLYTIFLYTAFYQVIADKLNKKNIDIVLDFICAITLLQVFWQILQFFGIWIAIVPLNGLEGSVKINAWVTLAKPLTCTAFTGLMSNINMTAAALAIGLPAFFRKKWNYFIPIIWLGLLLAKGMAGIIPAYIVTMVYIWMKAKVSLRTKVLIIIASLSVGAIYLTTFDKFQDLLTGSGRFPVWGEICRYIIPRKPVIGWGLGSFKSVFPAAQKAFGSEWGFVRWVQAHNEYLQVLTEQGAIGLAFIIGFIISLFRKGIKHRKESVMFIALIGVIVGTCNAGGNFLFHTTTGILFLTYAAILEKGACDERRI